MDQLLVVFGTALNKLKIQPSPTPDEGGDIPPEAVSIFDEVKNMDENIQKIRELIEMHLSHKEIHDE